MRINLVTPFAEKDAVKALGARWDPARKVWYVQDVKDLTPFKRWIPDPVAATQASAGAPLRAVPERSREASSGSGVITRPVLQVPVCGCDVLPWESCEHSPG